MRRQCAVAAALVTAAALAGSAAAAASGGAGAAATDVSAQERRVVRRAATRIEIRPLPGPLRRECVAEFQERWMPQWGGWVLYPGQRCWWTRGPY